MSHGQSGGRPDPERLRRQKSMITVTEKAKEKVQQIMAAENRAGQALRVMVQGGGCSGFQYLLNFAEGQNEGDQVLDCGGFKLVVDPISAQYLEGAEIEYLDGLNGTGFKVNNPLAKSTCGCGQSFGV